MAKLVKKKMNVGLFILLLCMAFIPGIIYAIYCAFPIKVPNAKPKNNGWLFRLIGAGLALVTPLICIFGLGINEDLGGAMCYFMLGLSAVMVLLSVCSINPKGVGAMTINSIITVLYLAIYLFFCFFGGFTTWLFAPLSLGGVVLTFMGISNGKKWVYYEKYADKEVPADTEIPVEKEDVAETENAENE